VLRIGVVGAGIQGMATAINIQTQFLDAQVTVIGAEFSPNIRGLSGATNCGAAFIMPEFLAGTPQELQKQWTKSTHDHLIKMVYQSEGYKLGINLATGYGLFTEVGEISRGPPHWDDILFGWRRTTPAELSCFPDKFLDGWNFTTVVVNPGIYTQYLYDRFRLRGGRIVQRKLTSMEEIADDYDMFACAPGLGAFDLLKDETMMPMRGQLISVEAPWIKHFYGYEKDEETLCYIIPRTSDVILGGTFQVGEWDPVVDPEISKRIMDDCSEIVPSLRHAKRLDEWTGLRPGRPSVRLEYEHLELDSGKKIHVVYDYGHGGAGVTLHWGCGTMAADLVKDTIEKNGLKSLL